MLLPSTFYDIRKKQVSSMYEAIAQDVDSLRQGGCSSPVPDLDSYPSRFSQIWDAECRRLIEFVAREQHVSIAQVLRSAEQDSETRNVLEWQERAMACEYYPVLNFELFGAKTFYLQDDLVQQLACTEMNVVAPLLQLPFPACMFVLTSRDAIDALYHIHFATIPAVKQRAFVDYKSPVSVFLILCEPNAEQPFRHLEIVAFHANQEEVHMTVKRSLCLADNLTLNEALTTDWVNVDKNLYKQRTRWDYENGWNSVSDDIFYGDGLLFFRIVLNAVLYLSSADADVEQRPSELEGLQERLAAISSSVKRREMKQAARHASRLPYIVVGKSISGPDKGEMLSPLLGEKRKLSFRFTVRGHWKNQACGVGMKDHVLRFIKPYNKGPEMADVINKPYLVR